MSRPGRHATSRRLASLIAVCLTALPLTYACGDDTTQPGASGDDTSSSGGADSAFHDVAADTHHAGDGPAGDGTQTDDGSGDDASENDVFIEYAVFEAGPLPDEGVMSTDAPGESTIMAIDHSVPEFDAGGDDGGD